MRSAQQLIEDTKAETCAAISRINRHRPNENRWTALLDLNWPGSGNADNTTIDNAHPIDLWQGRIELSQPLRCFCEMTRPKRTVEQTLNLFGMLIWLLGRDDDHRRALSDHGTQYNAQSERGAKFIFVDGYLQQSRWGDFGFSLCLEAVSWNR